MINATIMNELDGIIQKITSEEQISLVVVEAADINWHTLVIDNPQTASYLQEGNLVKLVFKESSVSIAKNITGSLSIRNRIPCIISAVQEGKVLSVVSLRVNDVTLISVITANAIRELNLMSGDEVEALIKTTDISLMQV